MAELRRSDPEPPPGPPEIQFTPGMADDLMQELAPFLAEDGIDVDNLEVDDLDTFQRALDRAVERRNMALFTPVGAAREIAVVTLHLVVEAILDNETALAGAILDQVEPESRTTPSRPSPAVRVSRWACSTAGCLGTTPTRPRTSLSTPSCRAAIGTASAPRRTCSPSPARDAPSGRSAPSSFVRAAGSFYPAAPWPLLPLPTRGPS